jgi:hypothetical protein
LAALGVISKDILGYCMAEIERIKKMTINMVPSTELETLSRMLENKSMEITSLEAEIQFYEAIIKYYQSRQGSKSMFEYLDGVDRELESFCEAFKTKLIQDGSPLRNTPPGVFECLSPDFVVQSDNTQSRAANSKNRNPILGEIDSSLEGITQNLLDIGFIFDDMLKSVSPRVEFEYIEAQNRQLRAYIKEMKPHIDVKCKQSSPGLELSSQRSTQTSEDFVSKMLLQESEKKFEDLLHLFKKSEVRLCEMPRDDGSWLDKVTSYTALHISPQLDLPSDKGPTKSHRQESAISHQLASEHSRSSELQIENDAMKLDLRQLEENIGILVGQIQTMSQDLKTSSYILSKMENKLEASELIIAGSAILSNDLVIQLQDLREIFDNIGRSDGRIMQL